MSKKETLKPICVKLLPRWVKMLDEAAIRTSSTRSAVIKSLLIDFCLRRTVK